MLAPSPKLFLFMVATAAWVVILYIWCGWACQFNFYILAGSKVGLDGWGLNSMSSIF